MSYQIQSRERVVIQDIVGLDVSKETLRDWPSGSVLLQAMLPRYADLLPITNPTYWQMAARRALLIECGFLSKDTTKKTNDKTISQVATLWNELIDEVLTDEKKSLHNDLLEFLGAGGTASNHRQLQWALMDCAPACQFNLHAHPNLELVYCIKGELHEIRLDDDDHVITKDFETIEQSPNNNSGKKNPKVIGPSLIGCQRPWQFKTLSQGNWLVNRVGTIHKSFTATKGDGCVLLTLWGGSHANIPDELSVVTKAVQLVDEKLKPRCAGCDPNSDELCMKIPETFLPDSEKKEYDRS